MAPGSRRITRRVALAAVIVLILAVVLFVLRWTSIERAGPPLRAIFPYGEMRVGIDASFPPFAVAIGDAFSGLDVDLARAIGERLGVPVRFVNLGYDGLYDALRVDQVDVLISALVIDPSRRDDVLYTTPYFNAGLVLVSDIDSPFATMDAMPGHALAFEFGSLADAEARKWLRRVLPFETRPYELTEDALDAVRLDEADAALVDAISARLYLRDHPGWQAQVNAVTDTWYAAATRIDRGQTWAAISHSIDALIADGSIEKLINQRFGP